MVTTDYTVPPAAGRARRRIFSARFGFPSASYPAAAARYSSGATARSGGVPSTPSSAAATAAAASPATMKHRAERAKPFPASSPCERNQSAAPTTKAVAPTTKAVEVKETVEKRRRTGSSAPAMATAAAQSCAVQAARSSPKVISSRSATLSIAPEACGGGGE